PARRGARPPAAGRALLRVPAPELVHGAGPRAARRTRRLAGDRRRQAPAVARGDAGGSARLPAPPLRPPRPRRQLFGCRARRLAPPHRRLAFPPPRLRLPQQRLEGLRARQCPLPPRGPVAMSEASSAADFVPDGRSLRAPRKASLMLVGEQPGDREDVEGEPFVGPAGRVLDEALDAAGIARGDVYLTNAVKHFKWRPQGKRRLHQTPRAGEVAACRPWLEAELEAVRPIGLLALGATAGKTLFGSKVRVGKDRGRLLESPLAPLAALTLHPSAVLRLRDRDEREEAQETLVEDLRMLAAAVADRA